MSTYTTIQGDMWDNIALKMYGSTEYIGYLMQNNLDLLDIFVFSSGTLVNVPDLPDIAEQTESQLWR